MISVFINELSFHGQLHDSADFAWAARVFYSVLAEVDCRRTEHSVYWDENLLNVRIAVEGQVLIASLNRLSDQSLRSAIMRVLMNRLNARGWKGERRHSPDDWFHWGEEIVTDTSIAELAEREIQNSGLLGLLVNFPQSRFSGHPVLAIVKNFDEAYSELACVETPAAATEWLDSNVDRPFEYDLLSTEPPADRQTILRDRSRFRSTSYRYDERSIYKEGRTHYYWYVDNQHSGHDAHLEVFNAHGRHLGEASLDGALDSGSIDPAKRLNLS